MAFNRYSGGIKMRNKDIKIYNTKLSWIEAVEQAKAEGHIFLGYTRYTACFKDLIIIRSYEVLKSEEV